jgi:hypothetical protein
MESKKINQLATELAPDLSDLTIIGDPTTGISKKITLSQMASLFTGTVEEYANFAAFPLVGVADTIYIAKDTNVIYRWDSTAYVVLSPNVIASLVFNDANGFDGTIALVGSVATLTITTALTTGSVPFIGASGALLQDNANFFWDDTNNRLGLGTNAPTTALDVFGSGIIGRINGTSTNNAYLGFASAGTNKWSVGNVQSDHRFRIFSEANSAELVSVLQTGEFGIGIANPTTKVHIDGGATALIANLDANVSVAKSISFRSDNSNRINLEVSGTESGSNAGANLFIRTYSDAGSLTNTPLTLTRSTGNIIFNSIDANGWFAGFSNSGTNFGYIGATSQFAISGGTATDFGIRSVGAFVIYTGGGNERLRIASTGAATFSNSLTTGDAVDINRTKSGSSVQSLNYLSIRQLGTDAIGDSLNIRFVNNTGIQIASISGILGGDNVAYGQLSFSIRNYNTDASFEAIRINNRGNVGINNSSPSYTLDVSGNSAATRFWVASGGNATDPMIRVKDDTDTGIFFPAANNMSFSTGATERVRLTGTGQFKATTDGTFDTIGGTAHELNQNDENWDLVLRNKNGTNPYGMFITYTAASPNNVISEFLYCRDGGFTVRAAIRSNGGFANFQANNVNLSDERTKKDIIPLESYWSKFKAIEIVKFKYKDQTHDDFNIGVIAQQVESVAPEFVDIDGWDTKPKLDEEGNEIISEEEPLKSVYTSDLHHATIKVLQEAMAKIEILEEEVKLLKAK